MNCERELIQLNTLQTCSLTSKTNSQRTNLSVPTSLTLQIETRELNLWAEYWTLTKMLSLSSFPSLSNSSLHPRLPSRPRAAVAPRRSVRCAAAAGDGDAFTAKSGYLFELSATEADSLTEYRVSKIAAIYYRKPLLVARRLVQTGIAFGNWFALRYADALMDRSDEMFQVYEFFFFFFNFLIMSFSWIQDWT